MKAVWSLWTKPLFCGSGISWPSFRNYLCSWVLSVQTCRRWFSYTELVTDSDGAALLTKDLGLDFDRVSFALDTIKGEDSDWWALGKLYTYMLQDAPFLHIDHDVFLWKPMPEELLQAPVIAQNPEPVVRGEKGWYQPEYLEAAIRNTPGGWLPEEWTWYTSRPDQVQTAYCCGIFGGNSTSFINHYAKNAIKIVSHDVNRKACMSLSDKGTHVALIEQYFLSACVNFYGCYPQNEFEGVHVQCLFANVEDAKVKAEKKGYTHLIGYAKSDSRIMKRLEDRVRRDHPALYKKCMFTANKIGTGELF